MQERRSTKTTDIPARIKRALSDRLFGGLDLGQILDHAGRKDIDAIRPFLTTLLTHHDWTVRADALEFVGRFRLRQFLSNVKTRLQDKNSVVRDYALTAYYDLLGPGALPVLERASIGADVGNRVTALVLRYVERKDEDVLKQLSRILTRKKCRFTHRYAALSTFDAYLDVGRYPEVITLFETVLRHVSDAPRTYGLDKDISKALKKWRNSRDTMKAPVKASRE